MIKDLLVSEYLKAMLGSHVIQVLRVIIGPPTSLNIRNVVWHGFPVPAEIPRRCIWFVILLVPSIGQILRNKNVTRITFREPVTFPDTSLISDTKLFIDENWSEVAGQSDLVCWNTQKFWEKVKQFYVNKKYSYCAAILLYYLEQGLRRVFATVNKCQHRILTAEATTLYTTFDEILDHSLPDDTENKLCQFLSPKFVEILLDHLQYQNGPRVRDRLSHGDTCWILFPWQLTCNLATIAVALTAKFIPDTSIEEVLNRGISKVYRDISEYRVQFHRITVLQKNIQRCCNQATKIDDLIRYNPDLSERDIGTEYPLSSLQVELSNDLQKCIVVLYDKWTNNGVLHSPPDCMSYTSCSRFSSTIDDILSHPIHTLYRDKQYQVVDGHSTDREGEVMSVLEHIISECLTVLNNLQDFVSVRQQQLLNKQLRSRQRENFKKFLTSFPAYVVVSNMSSYLCCWQLYHLDYLKCSDGYTSKIRFWKKCLQFCENLRTYSQSDKNKWTEGLTLICEYQNTLQSNLVTQLLCIHKDKT
ncbi:endoplasmic reticulum membrane-associated RNA degradation protein-like isoform X2 [Ruditapes philippinarum]|nr:endoplasmic reticulum membrane-associated RNA degradation protein-like isoform X2 [Ruditapes philippinarum]